MRKRLSEATVGEAPRRRLTDNRGNGGSYFTKPISDIEFIPSGCKLLDLSLGGGWARRRISNIVGDKSTGKTLLAIEASANFAQMLKKRCVVRYREVEDAFDDPYAESLGMPMSVVDREQFDTVEDLYEDIEKCVAWSAKHSDEQLYILDSLDALSDRAELARAIDKASYGANKAAMMSEIFRRIIRALKGSNITLMIVSQIRDKIGVTFGEKTTRSGGRALDFYASQVLKLAQLQRVTKTVRGVKRAIGIDVLARCSKNKVALPYREAEFTIYFGYGIDDRQACEKWLEKIKHPIPKGDDDALRTAVEQNWYELEEAFTRSERKYGG